LTVIGEDAKSDVIEKEDDDQDSDRTVRHNIDLDQDESGIGTPYDLSSAQGHSSQDKGSEGSNNLHSREEIDAD
jgi:hypothetical protein